MAWLPYLLLAAGVLTEFAAAFSAQRRSEDLNLGLVVIGIVLICFGLMLLTFQAGGLLLGGH